MQPRTLDTAIVDDPRVARVIDFYQHLTPSRLASLGEIYADDATFKDPFNQVRGLAAIGSIFGQMFAHDDAPRFVVTDASLQGSRAFLIWDFECRAAQRSVGLWRIHGATAITFDAQGKVQDHCDYWDAAEHVYARLPVIGSVVRWMQRRR